MLTRIRPARVAELARRELPAPVDVVNLITTERFSSYRWYALLVWPAMLLCGARVAWMGRLDAPLHGERQADKLLLVRYPSHRRFLAMTLNPYYLAINRLREAGVSRFEASFTHASVSAADLAHRRRLVGVHFRSPAGEDALGAVREIGEQELGELVYATRAVADLGFLQPPRATDPNPLRLRQLALFAAEGDASPSPGLTRRLEGVTDAVAVHAYRREPRSAYRPAPRRLLRALLPVAVLAAAAAFATPASGALRLPAIPIPGPLDGPLPRFTGAPASAQPLEGPFPPANPALAPDGRSGSGLAAGNGAASPMPGPLGAGTSGASALQLGTCASLAFDVRGRLLALCNGLLGPALRLLDPDRLSTIAMLVLPLRPNADRGDLAGGTHFVVRADGTLLVPTHAGSVLVVAVDAAGLRTVRSIDLRGLLAAGERVFAVAGGFDGRDWAVGTSGTVVTLPRDGAPPKRLALRDAVTEDLATDPSGAYVAGARGVYRLQAGPDGTPAVVWHHPLGGVGTPPAVVPGGMVAVGDGAGRVVVLRAEGDDAGRQLCAVPLFGAGARVIRAHLVVAGASIVATNAHGYDSLLTTEGGRTSTGGIARVDVADDGCRVAWSSAAVSPSAQAVVSRATGLLYTLTKPAGFPDAWNLTAIDWRTGASRFSALAGEGLGHNSEGGAVVLGPGGAAYAGTFGGVVRFGDGGA